MVRRGADAALRSFLAQQKRKTVTLDAMQAACRGMEYDAFHTAVAALESVAILVPVKASGVDHGGLARKYTIHRGPLFAETAARIQQEAIEEAISGELDLSWYMTQPYAAWQQDRDAISCLSHYLQALPCPLAGLPKTSLQQRSYDIFGDEKFLLAGSLLTHLGLSREALGVAPEADPLMMAFHPTSSMLSSPIYENEHVVYYHLIVENKAPWMALSSHLSETAFTSLILGYGWKILANIDQLPMQCGLPTGYHTVWYFGDFDWEGLRIWHELMEKCKTLHGATIDLKLASPFYAAFLAHPESRGKEQQTPAPEALRAFLRRMPRELRVRFRSLLEAGCYYPQEALSTKELLSCLKELIPERYR
ncbi:MAG: hypothetical protein SPL39_03710 [Selenomonadaceae bacterium]|nr:hypothetical protein [Selenomonadaceae bacterium]